MSTAAYWLFTDPAADEDVRPLFWDGELVSSVGDAVPAAFQLILDICGDWSPTAEGIIRATASGFEFPYVRDAAILCLLRHDPSSGRAELLNALRRTDTGMRLQLLRIARWNFVWQVDTLGLCDQELMEEVLRHSRDRSYWVRAAAVAAAAVCPQVSIDVLRVASWDESAMVRAAAASAVAGTPGMQEISLRFLVDRHRSVRDALLAASSPARTWGEALRNPASAWLRIEDAW